MPHVVAQHLLQLPLPIRERRLRSISDRTDSLIVDASGRSLGINNAVIDHIEIRILNLEALDVLLGQLQPVLAELVVCLALQAACTVFRQGVWEPTVVFGVMEHVQVVFLVAIRVLDSVLLAGHALKLVACFFLVETRALAIQEIAAAHIPRMHLNLVLVLISVFGALAHLGLGILRNK